MVPLSNLVLMGTGSPISQLFLPIGQPSEGQRPLTNPVTAKDLALAAAPGLYPKEPGTIQHKLGRPSGASVKHSCSLCPYLCCLQQQPKMGQGSRSEAGKQGLSASEGETSSSKMNHPVVRETSSPYRFALISQSINHYRYTPARCAW